MELVGLVWINRGVSEDRSERLPITNATYPCLKTSSLRATREYAWRLESGSDASGLSIWYTFRVPLPQEGHSFYRFCFGIPVWGNFFPSGLFFKPTLIQPGFCRLRNLICRLKRFSYPKPSALNPAVEPLAFKPEAFTRNPHPYALNPSNSNSEILSP